MNLRSFGALLGGTAFHVFIILLLITPLKASSHPWYRLHGAAEPVAINPAQGTVLGPAVMGRIGDFAGGCTMATPLIIYGYWPPSTEAIAKLEADLAHFLPFAEHLQPTAVPTGRPPLHEYFRQYIGIWSNSTTPLILVNGFRQLPEPGPHWRDWHADLIQACHGGTDYWSLQYDPVRRQFRGFTFNGSG